ncbi:MAG: hypothetical protein GX303_04040 [Clostridiales bacterium]|nr:hypothetical protein [Clostridiales bacterium]
MERLTKKPYWLIIAILAVTIILAVTGCYDPRGRDTSDTTTADTTITADETTATQTSSSSSSETEDVTTAPESTIADTTNGEHSELDEELEGVAFIGDSITAALYNFGIFKRADYFTKVGLTVKTAMTDPYIKGTSVGKVPVIDELNGKSYKKVVILFGLNEIGWVPSAFIKEYRVLVNAVKERLPDADIYLQSILPVTKERSDEAVMGGTNERIVEFNTRIRAMADEMGVNYLDSASVLMDENGCLPKEGAASDGVHLTLRYAKIWSDYIRENITKK